MHIDNITLDGPWYGAKCIFLHRDVAPQASGQVYEQRVVLIHAASASDALRLGELEARRYAAENDAEYLGFIDIFHLFSSTIGPGTEVYSLMQTSQLEPAEFVSHYFADGTQHSGPPRSGGAA